MAGFAWVGAVVAARCSSSPATTGSSACVLLIVASICLGCSLVVYDAILVRDLHRRTSATGSPAAAGRSATSAAACCSRSTSCWSRGHDAVRPEHGDWPCGSACSPPALWWAAFTIIPFLGLRDRAAGRASSASPAGSVRRELRPARAPPCGDLRGYPMTLTFLLAYLFYNDGIQTVIASRRRYGAEELGLRTRAADRHDPAGAVRRLRRRAALRPAGRDATAPSASILGSLRALDAWSWSSAFFLPGRAASPLFLVLAVAHRHRARRHPGAVPVALQPARSPAAGRRSTSASTRPASAGTCWFGTLLFGLVLPADRLLPAGDRRAHRLLRRSAASCCARVDVRARHPRGRQRGARRGLTARTAAAVTLPTLRIASGGILRPDCRPTRTSRNDAHSTAVGRATIRSRA